MTQQTEYIGCIDGNTIVLHRKADEIVLTFDGVVARLSIEAAIRLANLLPFLTPSSRPSQRGRRSVQPLVKRRSYTETIADLIKEGMIQVGTVLTIRHQDVDQFGTITMDGKIDINGHEEDTPSSAGKWVIGRECNGWDTWKLQDGRSLADLRWILRVKRFPDENHGYAIRTIQEKQMIATRWVNYALARGLDPGKQNDEETEAFLADRQLKSNYRYAENTLRLYRIHLRQWFNYYGTG